METKARFIAQVITGDNAARRAEDIGGQELSYAEVKAIASGNPAVLTLAEADAELQRLTVLHKNHTDEQFLARRSVRTLPETITGLSKRLCDFRADMATAEAHATAPVTVGSQVTSRNNVIEILGERLERVPEHVWEPRRIALGVYCGLRFGMVLHPQFAPEVYLEGATTRQSMLSREHHGPRAVLNALDRLAGGYGSECDRVRQDLAIAEAQLRDYHSRLGTPFQHEDYLTNLTALRDRLKLALSGAAPDPRDATVVGATELAEQIKALRASRTIEATPQRAGQRRSSGEEPVTSRIRRKAETALNSGQASESNMPMSPIETVPLRELTSEAISGDSTPPESTSTDTDTIEQWATKPGIASQERISRLR